MVQANAIRQAHGFRVPVDKGERQSTDLRVGILRRPFAPCGEERRSGHTGRTSLGSPQLATQLSNWLVNKAKENAKTVQGILGHARIQTMLDLYADEDLDEMIAAQEKFLDAVGFESGSVQ